MENQPTQPIHDITTTNNPLLLTQEMLSLQEVIEETMMIRLEYNGLQDAVNYAHKEWIQLIGVSRTITERGLRTISALCESADMFVATLKTYDLEFVSFVQLINNHDPDRISALLRTFAESSSEHEKNFKINDYLNDHKNAVICYTLHLLSPGRPLNENSVDVLINYAEKNGQLETAYNVLSQSGICVPRLYIEVAKYFVSVNRKSMAAQVYFEAGQTEVALALYIDMYKWFEALCVINHMNLSANQRIRRLRNLASHLQDNGVFFGAGAIYTELTLYSDAIRCFIQAHAFFQAAKLVKTVYPSMKEYLEQKLYTFAAEVKYLIRLSMVNVEVLTERIETIWKERAAVTRNLVTRDSDEYARIGERVALKAFRKHKGNLFAYIDMQIGAPYEDIGKMKIVHDKITEMVNMQSKINDVVSTLRGCENKFEGEYIRSLYSQMLSVFKNCAVRIWIPGLNKSAEEATWIIAAARRNLDILDHQYRYPPAFSQ